MAGEPVSSSDLEFCEALAILVAGLLVFRGKSTKDAFGSLSHCSDEPDGCDGFSKSQKRLRDKELGLCFCLLRV